ncbi:metallophosphoesterase [Paenibacillus koleovorans]|uniref:metallophosphoesterase n=1 Tax=Paenibacillus koleovorans TaxID=121608 RepID=UPI000FD839C9|nr:metallophosphoesterase [Paenibacillus koleovorans]
MNILFLHLSDIHIEDRRSINRFFLSKIVHAVRAHKPFEHMILILSGDIANSGQSHQYEIAYYLVGSIIKLVKEECEFYSKIQVLVVPGNHDVDLSIDPLRMSDLSKMRVENSFGRNANKELERQTSFFNFANRNNLFNKDKLLHQSVYKLTNDFSIEVNLINSALFSTLEDDKGFHFLPQDVIQNLNNPTDADFVISVMHHPTDWFVDQTMQGLENVIYSKSSLVFYGHKHYQDASIIINKKEKGALIQAGGCLSEKNDWSTSQFLIGRLSFSNKNSVKYIYNLNDYKWNPQQKQYEKITENDYELPNKPSKERRLTLCAEYEEKILNDLKQETFNDFTQYFVFPRIEADGLPPNQTKEFVTDESFINEIIEKKQVMIYGQYNTGKTTVLKWLFLKLNERGYSPIFCDLDNIQGNPKRIIKNCFEDIYGEDVSDFQRFQQMSKDKKIFIIDDVDLIKPDHFERLVEGVRDEFACFVFASKENHGLDMIERMKSYLKTTDSIYKYKLTMFYSDKRSELIQKAVGCHLHDQRLAEKVIDTISEAIKAQKRLIRFDPDFILKYVAYYCRNVGDSTFRTTNIFSKVFEANLINSLNKYSAKISVEKAFMLLSAIAYNIHFKKKYPIDSKGIYESIENYNLEYGSTVSPVEALDLFIKSKILVLVEEEIDEQRSYRFANKSYLAFFVARRLNVQYHETGDEEELQYIIKNICFGINSDILLFITYITDNVRVLRFILDMVGSYTKNWTEFTLNNIPQFLRWSRNHQVESPADDAYEQHQKSEIIEEKQVQNGIETLDIYHYTDDEAEEEFNKILRAIQLLSIVARCLPIFEHIMRKPEKDRFVEQIYELPNKIFNVWASRVDEDAEEVVKYFEDQPDQYYVKQKSVSKQDIVQALQWAAMSFLLDLYKMSMSQAVKEHTLNYIESFPKEKTENSLYELQRIIALEIQGTGNLFVNSAIDLKERAKEPLLQTMIARVASNASVFKKMDYKENQKLQEAFFKNNQKQRQMLTANRQRNRKYQDE